MLDFDVVQESKSQAMRKGRRSRSSDLISLSYLIESDKLSSGAGCSSPEPLPSMLSLFFRAKFSPTSVPACKVTQVLALGALRHSPLRT